MIKNIENTTENKLWSKHFAVIILINFFISITLNMQGSTISLYVQHIGGDKASVGIIIGAFTLSALLFRPLFGNLTDNKSRRMVLILGIVILAFVSLMYNLAYTVGILIFLRFLQGIGLSAETTALGTIISDIVPHSRLGEGLGFSSIAATIATGLGPVLGLYLIGHYNYNVFFTFTFVFGIIALTISLLINYEKKEKKLTKIATDNEKVIKLKLNACNKLKKDTKKKAAIFEKTAIPSAAVVFFMMLTFSSVLTFVPSYAASRGIKDIGLFFTVYAVAFLVSRLITGKLSDRYGAFIVILPGMLLLILSFIILAFATTLSGFLIAGSLYGFGFSCTQPTLNSLAVASCPSDRRGAANATFFSAMDIGYCVGAIVWGMISQKLGFTYAYLASAVCIVCSLSIYIIIFNKKKKISKDNNISVYEAVEG